MDILKMNRKFDRRTVKPGTWRCFYGGGDVTSIGSVKMRGDLDFDNAVLPKNLPAPTLDGHAARKKYVDDLAAVTLAALGSKRGAQYKRTTDLSIGAGGGYATFDATPSFNEGMDVSAADRIKVTQAGYYFINYFGLFNGAGASVLGIVEVIVNQAYGWIGDVALYTPSLAGPGTPVAQCMLGPFPFNVGDYIQIRLIGGNGDSSAGIKATTYPAYFTVYQSATNAVGGGDLKSDGTIPMTADFDNAGFQSKNLPTPTADGHAARKKYVDDAIAALALTFGSAPYKKAVARRTTGNVVLGALADIGGLTVTFTAAGGECEMKFSASLALNDVISASLVFDIDGGASTRTFPLLQCIVGAGSDDFRSLGVTVVCPISLSAGVHTVKIRMSGSNATLVATDAAHPASLVVDYQ